MNNGVFAAVLAAGESKRFGPENKLLFDYRGRVLIQYALDAVVENVSRLCLITGHEHERFSFLQNIYNLEVTRNPEYAKGQSSSVLVAVQRFLASDSEFLLLHLGDQPSIKSDHIRSLIELHLTSENQITVSEFSNTFGPPWIMKRECVADFQFALLSGDGKAWMKGRDPGRLSLPEAELDIDTRPKDG